MLLDVLGYVGLSFGLDGSVSSNGGSHLAN